LRQTRLPLTDTHYKEYPLIYTKHAGKPLLKKK